MRILFFLGAAFALGACALLPDPQPHDRFTIACWNVDNLFDEVADGDEYPEFSLEKGWDRGRFWERCATLAGVIRTLAPGGPDILVLEEVENSHTATVLNDRFLADLGYRHRVMAPDDTPGVKTVILSRFRPLHTGLLTPGGDEGEPLRPLVEAEFDLGGRSLVVVGNHWKSRLPEAKTTERSRRLSADLLRRRFEALDARGDGPLLVALGDFNTSAELSRVWPDRALTTGDGAEPAALRVYTRRSSIDVPAAGSVWDPWELVDSPAGSYLYRGDWSRLDHIFVGASGLKGRGWRVEDFRVAAFGPEPVAYRVGVKGGVSDHFPLVLTWGRSP